jgi:microcystin-dependent protein
MAIKDLPPVIKTAESEAGAWSQLIDWLNLVWKFVRTPALVISASGDAPTTPTGSPGDSSLQIANDAFVQQELAKASTLSDMYGMSGVEGTLLTVPTPIPASVSQVVAGTLTTHAGTSAPSGYLVCPTAATNISRTGSNAALFAAIGTTWGVGDGSTTFGMPWFAPDFVMLQANANVGTTTTGAVISHSHADGLNTSSGTIAAGGGIGVHGNTAATGGTNNLAAGTRVLICVKL